MPISPERQKLYPGGSIRSVEWLRDYRAPILERAGHRCEGTAQRPHCRAENGKPHPETGSTVVLTIAHMDQDPGNNDWANLRALCQRCHNRWDSAARTRNAAATRARKLGAGTLDLFTCEALP
ncbi:HNH endonuclease [Methylorubrum sp. POS3]|uniref:HNH endonuclease n=1 Tax=Methylorubrum sp. POS3 TaxID=2998492 RepID=UPI00372C7CEB